MVNPTYTLYAHTKSRNITVTIVRAWFDGKLRFFCGAVESAAREEPKKVTNAKITKAIGDVFDDHGHAIVGTFSTLKTAQIKGEAFRKKWLRARRRIEKCACEPIKGKH